MSRWFAKLAPRIWFTRRALVAALAVAAALALGATWTPLVGIAGASAIVLVGLLLGDAFVLASARVTVTRDEPERFVLGEAGRLVYAIDNRGPATMRLALVEAPIVLLDIGEDAVIATVAGRASGRVSLGVVPRERGDGELRMFAYRLQTRLGLLARVVRRASPARIRVWPDLSLLRKGATLAGARRTIDPGLRRMRMRGAGTDFESLRDYAVGDPYRDIAWTATARRGKPIVVAHTVERSQDVLIVIDAGRLMLGRVGAHRKFDYAVAAALTLAGAAAAEGDRVGAIAFAGAIVDAIPARNGRGHAAAIAQRMHALQPRFEEADYEGAFALVSRRQSKRSLIVVFTDMFDPVASAALLAHLGRLATRHFVVVVLFSDDAVHDALAREPRTADDAYRAAVAVGIAADRRLAVATLERLGIVVIDVPANEVSVALVNRYVEIKSRGAL